MANFYLVEDLADVAVGDEVTLSAAESRHIVTVSRTRVADRLIVGNGRGMTVDGTVLVADPGGVLLRVDACSSTPPAQPRLILVQALAKGGRDELAVQAATELGADVIVPWSAERCVVRWNGEKALKGRERWASIAREATKQSMRPWLPRVDALTSTAELVREADTRQVLVLEPSAETALSDIVVPGPTVPGAPPSDVQLIVGPEGGIAPQELQRLTEAGARAVRLGQTVLRTSTAGPAALAVLNTMLARW